MFAYCNNSPANGCDPCGSCFHRLDFWNDCENCGGETIDQKLENLRGTHSRGLTVSISTGIWTFGIQIATSVDLKGNVELQYTPYGGLSTGTPQADISVFTMTTNAPDTKALQGMGYNIGASGAIGGALGVDGVIIPSASGQEAYLGLAASCGIGAGADFHVTWGETKTICGYNVFDVLEQVLGIK